VKKDHEILNKFISCLPEQLASYVRDSIPKDTLQHCPQLKWVKRMVIEYTQPSVSALYPKSASACDRSVTHEVADIKEQVSHLTNLLSKVLAQSSKETLPVRGNAPSTTGTGNAVHIPYGIVKQECYICGGSGHIRKNVTGMVMVSSVRQSNVSCALKMDIPLSFVRTLLWETMPQGTSGTRPWEVRNRCQITQCDIMF